MRSCRWLGFWLASRIVRSSAIPNSNSATSFSSSALRPWKNGCVKKKRLSRMQCRLSALPTNRGVSWLSAQIAAELVGGSDAEARILLLPTLRHRLVSVGPRRGPHGQTTDAWRGTGGEFGGLVDRQFRRGGRKSAARIVGTAFGGDDRATHHRSGRRTSGPTSCSRKSD